MTIVLAEGADLHHGTEPVGTLIVGASQAGAQLAASLREAGAAGRVTLLGGESRPPYQRPPLSKAFLAGDMPEHRLALRDERFYEANAIDLICGEWVEGISLQDVTAGSGVAHTSSGRHLAFDRLALTTGGAPRRLSMPGADLAGLHYLRDVDDSVALRADVAAAQRVVVVGGGFVGLEAAAAGRAAGKEVTVVEAADRLLARAVAPETSQFYLDAHRRRGTEVLLGVGVTGFAGQAGRVEAAELSDGRRLPADVVVIGIGLLPHVELADELGLECAAGIVVDARSRTSNPAIVAAGDCTVLAHPDHGHLRLESVPNAVAQAKAAAATLTGSAEVPQGVPWFWSDQGELKLQIAGLSAGYDETVVRGNPGQEQFSVFYYRAAQLIAVDAVNTPRDFMAVRKILGLGGNVPSAAAGDPSRPLKEFFSPAVA